MKTEIINVIEFGKNKKIVHDSTCIINVAASKVSFGMHNIPASELSQCVRATAGLRRS